MSTMKSTTAIFCKLSVFFVISGLEGHSGNYSQRFEARVSNPVDRGSSGPEYAVERLKELVSVLFSVLRFWTSEGLTQGVEFSCP